MAKAGVYGGKNVADALGGMPKKLTKSVMSKVRRDALMPILAAAKGHLMANGSVHRGILLNGMVISDQGAHKSVVIAAGKAVKIAHLVEFGTSPHYQPNRHSMHPGARPKPFLRPAFEEMKDVTASEVNSQIMSILMSGAK